MGDGDVTLQPGDNIAVRSVENFVFAVKFKSLVTSSALFTY